jgi:hypothetical protein
VRAATHLPHARHLEPQARQRIEARAPAHFDLDDAQLLRGGDRRSEQRSER